MSGISVSHVFLEEDDSCEYISVTHFVEHMHVVKYKQFFMLLCNDEKKKYCVSAMTCLKLKDFIWVYSGPLPYTKMESNFINFFTQKNRYLP